MCIYAFQLCGADRSLVRERIGSRFLRWSSLAVACGALLLGSARRSGAATITVTTAADSGPGSLRAAVAQANIDSPGDAINFDLPMGSTITLTTGQISITNTMSISGPGASKLTIDGNNSSRIFYC